MFEPHPHPNSYVEVLTASVVVFAEDVEGTVLG